MIRMCDYLTHATRIWVVDLTKILCHRQLMASCTSQIRQRYDVLQRQNKNYFSGKRLDRLHPNAVCLAKCSRDSDTASETEEERFLNQFISFCLLKVRSGELKVYFMFAQCVYHSDMPSKSHITISQSPPAF